MELVIAKEVLVSLLFTFVLCNILPIAYGGESVTPQYEVRVLNYINPHSPMRIHCASGDDELGYHTLYYDQSFHWHFRGNLFGRTLFFCRFWWNNKQKAFHVFDKDLHKSCFNTTSGDDHDPLNLCSWVVKADGFYFTNTFTWREQDLQFKYSW